MKERTYEYLKELYPEYITKEQVYKICKISKESAKYLLDNGIIPCKIYNRLTHKYKVALVDVIDYLIEHDATGESKIPIGTKKTPRKHTVEITEEYVFKHRQFFQRRISVYPDVVDIAAVAEIVGLSTSWLLKCVENDSLRCLSKGNSYLFPKPYILDFVTSSQYIRVKNTSAAYLDIQREFNRSLKSTFIPDTEKEKRKMNARIISINMEKGGVSKTTSSINIAAALADIGKN